MAAAKVSLGGVEYAVPPLNIGQIERLAEAFQGSAARAPFEVIRIALVRASPAVGSGGVDAIEATIDEIRAAAEAIMAASGFTQPASPPAAPPAG